MWEEFRFFLLNKSFNRGDTGSHLHVGRNVWIWLMGQTEELRRITLLNSTPFQIRLRAALPSFLELKGFFATEPV